MSILTLYTRSFHPDANFGAGGLGFKGDNRGFSTADNVTSRIWHIQKIDLVSAVLGVPECESDPSENAVAHKVVNLPGHAADIFNDGIDFLGDIAFDPETIPDFPDTSKAPPMSTDYIAEREQPRHEERGIITPYRKDGNQSVNLVIKYAGQNFAFWGHKTDFGHWLYRNTVPDLDVVNRLTLDIIRDVGKIRILCTIAGDSFPNCEAFLVDNNGHALWLNSHVRVGTAATQLYGAGLVQMCHCNLWVDWNSDDTFGDNVEVFAAKDYESYSVTTITNAGILPYEDWQKSHYKRNASGGFFRQLQDNVPIPTTRSLADTREDLLDINGPHLPPL